MLRLNANAVPSEKEEVTSRILVESTAVEGLIMFVFKVMEFQYAKNKISNAKNILSSIKYLEVGVACASASQPLYCPASPGPLHDPRSSASTTFTEAPSTCAMSPALSTVL